MKALQVEKSEMDLTLFPDLEILELKRNGSYRFFGLLTEVRRHY